MPDFSNWLGTNRVIDPTFRAVRAWSRILEKPSEIEVVRVNPVTLVRTVHTVTVRLEFDNESDEYSTVGGTGVNQMGECIAFGIKDHPTLPDTNLQRDDTFYYNGHNFRVVNVIPTIGELQFLAEAQI